MGAETLRQSPGETPDDRPVTVLRGYRLTAARVAWLAVASLAVALAAAGQPALYARFHALERYDPERREIALANLAELGLSVELYAAYLIALLIILSVVCFAIAAIIFFRRSDQPMALFVSLLLVLMGATFSGSIEALAEHRLVLEWLQRVLTAVSLATVILVLYLFPDGKFMPRWTRWLAIVAFVAIVPSELVPGSPRREEYWPGASYTLFVVGMFVLGVIAQVYRYRNFSGYWQRQQTKWIVLGFAVGLSGYSVIGLLPLLWPSLQPGTLAQLLASAATISFLLLIPLSFGVAILRYHLWDIDVIINRTLVYGLLTALLLIAYFGSTILLQSLFRAVTGQSSQMVIIISTLMIAALFQPLRRRVQSFIDRRFYRRKYDAAQIVSAFSTRMRNEIDLPALTQELIAMVQTTMQPASISLWLRPASPESERPHQTTNLSLQERSEDRTVPGVGERRRSMSV